MGTPAGTPAAAANTPDAAAPQTLLLQRRGPVLHVTLNRPQARNAMTLAMVHELRAVLARAEADPGVRVLVLRGAGGHFCAGADLADMSRAQAAASGATAVPSAKGMADASADAEVANVAASVSAADTFGLTTPIASTTDPIAALNARFGELCGAYARTGLATVAVLEGTVMGGGFGLACVADVAMAGEDVEFRLPETSLGLLPAQIAPFLVERLGYSQARRLSVTGGRLGASAALAIGLVHEVHASAGLDDALQHVLRQILQAAPGAVAATKALLARARFTPPEALVQEAAAAFSQAARGPEGREGTAAFRERRPPSWAVEPE